MKAAEEKAPVQQHQPGKKCKRQEEAKRRAQYRGSLAHRTVACAAGMTRGMGDAYGHDEERKQKHPQQQPGKHDPRETLQALHLLLYRGIFTMICRVCQGGEGIRRAGKGKVHTTFI